ncbi:CPBP family glutamic-type intramembrane protease [Nocardia amikacinitolerans]|uniref:CPBP family glutamic-type intramembrane protease n=1 Tax=Nocardia amikacinitolerans TaxID=756689 RepID=UPI0020A23E5E|nr:CPBP family intramembrane glutamic endopeptidase [Nocardia amikacinitolerans]
MTATELRQNLRPERDRRRMTWLAIEFALLYLGLVGGYAALGSPGSPIPFLIVLAVGAHFWLRGQRVPSYGLRDHLRMLRTVLPSMLALWVAAAVAIGVALAVLSPDRLFELPRAEPLLWAMVMVFYPLFSVYPQELIFRKFLFQRYAPAFGTGWALIAANAAAFGFAHIIFGNWIAVALTLVGGVLFGYRYRQTGSLLVVSVEHALYGCLAFTIGLGGFLYHGAS